METRFDMERLIQPTMNATLKPHNIYVIRKHDSHLEIQGDKATLVINTDSPPLHLDRVKCVSFKANIYLLEIVDEKDSPTGSWIKMTHEDYDRDYTLVEAVTAKRMLDKLSKEQKPEDIKF